MFTFSKYNNGYTNPQGKLVMATRPECTMSVAQMYDYIRGEEARYHTETLRNLTDHTQAQAYKMANFKIVTLGGIFNYRRAKDIAQESGLMILDVDDLESPEEVQRVRQTFIEDKNVISAIVFTSPSGDGVKAGIVRDGNRGKSYREEYEFLSRYYLFHYGITLDSSGCDICRACYLPYDPTCYINEQLFSNQ